MVKPHSMDMREHAMQRLATGETTYQVAAALNVAVSSVIKWAQKHRKSGSVAPGKMGGHKPFVIEGRHKEHILNEIEKNEFVSLNELTESLKTHGLKVHPSSISRFLLRENVSLKVREGTILKKDRGTQFKDLPLKLSAAKVADMETSDIGAAGIRKALTGQAPVKSKAKPSTAKLTTLPLDVKKNKLENNGPQKAKLSLVQSELFLAKTEKAALKIIGTQTKEQNLTKNTQDISTQDISKNKLFKDKSVFSDISPLSPVIESLNVLETFLRCNRQISQTFSTSARDIYTAIFTR